MAKHKRTKRMLTKKAKKSSAKTKGFLFKPYKPKRSKLVMFSFALIFAVIATALLYKSFAASYSNFDEAIQIHDINTTRVNKGLAKVIPTSCIQQVARDWSVNMSKNGFRHNPDPISQIVAKCNVAGKWSWEGENIGYHSGCPDGDTSPNTCSQDLYNAFTSPTEVYNCVSKIDTSDHYCNITSNLAMYVGVGAYRDDKGGLWITQNFLRCVGCGLPAQPITYWTLEGGVTASSPGVARAKNISVKRGAPITWYHDVKNNGPITASFNEHEDFYHYNSAGTLVSSGAYYATRASIPWGKVFVHTWQATIPNNAPIGYKYCHRVWYDEANGPNTGGEARPKPPDNACVTVVS